MRLSVSNLAWDPEQDQIVAGLLSKSNINAIDIAPGKYFPSPLSASDKDILSVKSWWDAHDIRIIGMQSLLFGTQGLNVFGNSSNRKDLLNHLNRICHIGNLLGATRLVFGSPKNRDRSGFSDSEAMFKAIDFFTQLGRIAESHNVIICLEPNPSYYGCNFMTNTDDTAKVVEEVSLNSIKMQFDTGAIGINSESVEYICKRYKHLIGHIHISDKDLTPIGDGKNRHIEYANMINRYFPNFIATIEMIKSIHEPPLEALSRAILFTKNVYQ
ncbi:sugar phosphate isomerase/epimerase family protein [Mangrovibacter plantisponsor]|uniref:Sugar phosphate isomerase/epimerase n=1 Tax=Mangrovibacter plantisponsor TaxID=451513 RepID=A0A317Q5W9_9ENTR|nr:TIM barrel protein [Mangrovibacter plantisponsor]PWW11557.1 sugar phosphate isomerase/epimerase [Mangrovibacter plantisponsor]